MNRFEIKGITFEVGDLSSEQGCKGFALVGQVAGPALAELIANNGGNIAQALAPSLAKADLAYPIAKLFAEVTKVYRTLDGRFVAEGETDAEGRTAKPVQLRMFFEECFKGRLSLLMAFALKCAALTYSDDFLGESSALSEVLAELL